MESEAQASLIMMRERRSERNYASKDVPLELVNTVLEAGQWAPTAYNVQEARFVVLQDPKLVEEAKAFAWGCPKSAPVVIVICADERVTEVFQGELHTTLVTEDIAMAAQNMLLMAHALDLGACVVASFSQAGVSEYLNLPSYLKPMLLVSLGYVKARSTSVARKHELSEITFWNGYTKKE